MSVYAGRWGPEVLIDSNGRPYLSTAYTVRLTGTTTPATIYTGGRTKTGATTTPGLITSVVGNASFYADPGDAAYDIVIGGAVVLAGVTVLPDGLEPATPIVVNLATTGADQTAVLQAAITAAMAPGGSSWLVLNAPGTVVLSSAQITFPNTGTPPKQRSLRITGLGGSHNGQGGAPYGGTQLDLQWVGGAGVGKIETHGLGLLVLEHMTLMDTADGTTDFIHTTGTTIDVSNGVEFYGKTAANVGTSTFPVQDAIVLGGTGTTLDNSATGPYQGYGSRVQGCHFNRVRRAVYCRTYCNGVSIRDNTVWVSCGADSTAAAFEVLGGGGNSDAGLLVVGNIIEMSNYVYGVKLASAQNGNFGPNGFFDPAGGNLGCYYVDAAALFNTFVAGYHSDSVPFVAGDATAKAGSTIINGHQSQHSNFGQPVDFANQTYFKSGSTWSGGGSNFPIIQSAAAQSDSQTMIEALRSAAEGTNPGTVVWKIIQTGQMTLGGDGPGLIMLNKAGSQVGSIDHTGIVRSGLGGAINLDSGTGGSFVDVKCFAFRVKKYTDGTFSHQLGANNLGFFGATAIAQIARKGQLTDNSGGTSGGATVAAVTDVASAANAVATLAAKINALETVLSGAGGGYGLTA